MTNKKYKSISISNLIINPDNDRFESVENEKQAIDIMLTKLGDKIYYIAIHILENGLSPKPFYVMPSKKSNKKFLVKEGNRRTTALKLMANPKLIDSKKDDSIGFLLEYSGYFYDNSKTFLDILATLHNARTEFLGLIPNQKGGAQ